MYVSTLWLIIYFKIQKYKYRKVTDGFRRSRFITSEIKRKAISHRNALKRKYNKSRTPNNLEAYRIMRNRIVTMQHRSIVKHCEHLCINAPGKPKEFSNSLRPLIHSKRCAPKEYILLKENNKIIKDQNQVTKILNSFFTNATERLDIQQYTSLENQPNLLNIPRNRNQDVQFDFNLINHELVKTAMKANKATGHDHIPPRALKAFMPSITQPLSHS